MQAKIVNCGSPLTAVRGSDKRGLRDMNVAVRMTCDSAGARR